MIVCLRRSIAAYSREIIIASVVFIGCLVMLLALYAEFGPEFYRKAGSFDIRGYLTLGESIAAGRGFQYEGFISAMRTPAYPLFLALFYFFHLPLWAIPFVQNMIAAANAVLVYRIGALFLSKRAGTIAALMFGLDPLNLYHSNIVMSETFFLLFLLLTILVFGRWYAGGPGRFLPAALGLLLGVTTLVRPLALFLPGIFVPFLLWRWHAKKAIVPEPFPLRPIAVFLLCLLLVILPWSLRQKHVFGSYQLTNLDTAILYTRAFPVVMADEWQISADAASKRLIAELPVKIPNFDQNVLDHTFAYNETLELEMKQMFPRHIPALIRGYAAALIPSGIISTGYQILFNRFSPTWYIGDPDLLGMAKAGQYRQMIGAIVHANGYQIVLLAGGVAWIGIYLCMIAGIIRAWRGNTMDRSHLALLLALVAFFTVFAIGPPVWARYRMISYPFIFLLFALFFERKKHAA